MAGPHYSSNGGGEDMHEQLHGAEGGSAAGNGEELLRGDGAADLLQGGDATNHADLIYILEEQKSEEVLPQVIGFGDEYDVEAEESFWCTQSTQR